MGPTFSTFIKSTIFLVFAAAHITAQQQANWSTQADNLRGQNGQSDDLLICAAAAHAGLITPANGGNIVIEIKPDACAYAGSVRNGVKSNP